MYDISRIMTLDDHGSTVGRRQHVFRCCMLLVGVASVLECPRLGSVQLWRRRKDSHVERFVVVVVVRSSVKLWIALGTINGPWKCESSISLQPEALERAKAGASQSIEPVQKIA